MGRSVNPAEGTKLLLEVKAWQPVEKVDIGPVGGPK
jgi:hypothetical protein